MLRKGWFSGTHLDILCSGALGGSWKGSTGSQMEGEHQELDGKVTFRPSERSGHLWKITVA